MLNTTHQHLSSSLGIRSAAAVLAAALTLAACGSDTDTSSPITAPPTSTTDAPSRPSAPAPVDTMPPPETGDPAADDLFEGLAERGFEGVVAVRTGDDVTARAFGIADRELGTAMDTETVFDIGSVTKQITAAAILRLEMDGALATDDRLGDHVAGLPADIAAITLHQLLTHTSGMPHGFGADDEPLDRSGFVARVADTALRSEPGVRFEYSNVGYSLLALVIEAASGSPYETYLREALFEPAGMMHTGYVMSDWGDLTVAVGYDGVSGTRFGRPNEQPWAADGPYWNLHGNGGLLSTAGDMLRWDDALTNGAVLDEAAHAKLIAPHVADQPAEGVAYAYGWIIVPRSTGGPIVLHAGGNEVFYGELVRVPDEDLAVFAITNSMIDADGDVATDVLDRLLNGGGEDAGADSETSQPDPPASDGEHAVADADPCGFESLTIATLPAYPELEALPNSAAGRATGLLIDLLSAGDAQDRLEFATDHVADEFGGGDPAEIAAALADLRDLFGGNEVSQVFQEGDDRFHLVTSGPAMDLMLSVGFDGAESELVICLGVTQ